MFLFNFFKKSCFLKKVGSKSDRIAVGHWIAQINYNSMATADRPAITIPEGATVWAVAGRIGTGKNHVAERLVEMLRHDGKHRNRVMCLAFGDPLKHYVLREHPEVRYEDVFHKKTARSRELLQRVGMEVRERIGQDAWTRETFNIIRMHFEAGTATHFIITDLRFLDEAQLLHALGVLIVYLHAPNRNLAKLRQEANGDEALMAHFAAHTSEQQMVSDEFQKCVTMTIRNDEGEADPLTLQYMLERLILRRKDPTVRWTQGLLKEHNAVMSHFQRDAFRLTPDHGYPQTYAPNKEGSVTSWIQWPPRLAVRIETTPADDGVTLKTDIKLLAHVSPLVSWGGDITINHAGLVSTTDQDKLSSIYKEICAYIEDKDHGGHCLF
jgi:dephospho-CoA kinase